MRNQIDHLPYSFFYNLLISDLPPYLIGPSSQGINFFS